MSLTHFIKIPSVRKKFNNCFPRPEINLKGEIKSEPISKSHPIIGTAIDYLIRFQLKQVFPKAKENPWVSEIAIQVYADRRDKKYFTTAIRNYTKFIKSGIMTKDLIKSAIDLAKFDIIFRSGGMYYPNDLGHYKRKDVKELTTILNNIDFQKLKIEKRCVLNPAFGRYSRLIGGADADLIIDNILIDIKNTKKLSISREMLNQIIGYYFLGKIGKVKGVGNWDSINEIGFYFSRYDILYLFKINELIVRKKRASFEKWFIKSIHKYNEAIRMM